MRRLFIVLCIVAAIVLGFSPSTLKKAFAQTPVVGCTFFVLTTSRGGYPLGSTFATPPPDLKQYGVSIGPVPCLSIPLPYGSASPTSGPSATPIPIPTGPPYLSCAGFVSISPASGYPIGYFVAQLLSSLFQFASVSPGPCPTMAPTPRPSASASAPPSPSPSASASSNPPVAPTPNPNAVAAQSFTDAVGVNVHLGYYGTPYDPSNLATIQAQFAQLGVKHLRDGMILGSSQAAQAPEFSQLATNDGIRFDFIMTPGATQAQVTQWLNATGNSATADACEYDNEYDISHPSSDTNWPATDRANGVTVFNACKSIGASIYGPSMGGGTGGYSQVGDVSSYVDYSNIHDYFSWRNPGTGGWGGPDAFGANYGSLAYNVNGAKVTAPSKPTVATETGYGQDFSSSGNYVPDPVYQRYILRTFLEGYRSGIKRTYKYEYADLGANGGPTYGQFGLVDQTLYRKPVFYALANLLALLKDGAAPSAGYLNYAIAGGDANLHSLLFHKSDGTFDLVLWEETQEFTGDTTQIISPAVAENLTITFGTAPSSLTAYKIVDGGSVASTTLTAGTSVPLSVDGHVTDLHIGTPSTTLALVTPAPATPAPTATPTSAPTPTPAPAPGTTVSVVQQYGNNNGGGANYGIGFPAASTVGNFVFASLANPPANVSSLGGGTVIDSSTSSIGGVASTTYGKTSAGETTENVTENGGYASGVVTEFANVDPSFPVAAHSFATGTSSQVTCGNVTAPRSNSLPMAYVTYNAGRQNTSLLQTPTAPPGWVYVGNSNADFNQVFVFKRSTVTGQNEVVQGISFNPTGHQAQPADKPLRRLCAR